MNLSQTVDVDILVANYNNGPFLEKFFESVIASTVMPQKLVIVNDGSLDNSEDIIRAYSDKYEFICPIFLDSNIGFANALNVGIDYLTSTYTIRVDPDDYLYPNRIKAQYNNILTNDYDVVGSNIQYFDSSSMKDLFKSNVPCKKEDVERAFKMGACGVIHGSTILKTSLLKKYKYVQTNVPAEDYELFSKIILGGGCVMNMPDTLTAIRVHVNSVSNDLPYSTIEKTFELTEQLWGKHYNSFYIWFRYIHLKYYRSFLFERNVIKKCLYLLVSSIAAPIKVIKRLITVQ